MRMLVRSLLFIALATVSRTSYAALYSSSYPAPYTSSYRAPYGSSSAAQFYSGQAQTTVDLWVGPGVADDHFAASVVNADACITTYGLACTAGAFYIGSQPYACDPAWTWFATYGPNTYRSLAEAQVGAFSGRTLVECSVDTAVSAVCTIFASDIVNGYHTASSTTFTVTGAANLASQQIPVTAGAAKLFPPGACTASASAAAPSASGNAAAPSASGNAAAPSASGNAAAPTAVIDVYKVLVVPGAAALLGAFA